jgi:hypothetical protein
MKPTVRWRRRLEVGDDVWVQGTDGSWSRWDDLRSDWVADPAGPPGGAPPLAPESGVPYVPGPARDHRRITAEFFATWAGLVFPAIAGLGAMVIVLVPVVLLWNAVFSPWLTAEIRIGPTFLYMLGASFTATLFLAIGGTLLRWTRTTAGRVAGVAIILGGPGLVLLGVATLLQETVGELLGRPETAMTAVLLLAGIGIAAVLRIRWAD